MPNSEIRYVIVTYWLESIERDIRNMNQLKKYVSLLGVAVFFIITAKFETFPEKPIIAMMHDGCCFALSKTSPFLRLCPCLLTQLFPQILTRR